MCVRAGVFIAAQRLIGVFRPGVPNESILEANTGAILTVLLLKEAQRY